MDNSNKISTRRKFLKNTLLSFLSLLVPYSAFSKSKNILTKIRFSRDSNKKRTRLVFDLANHSDYKVSKKNKSKNIYITIPSTSLSPNFKVPNLKSYYVKNIKISRSKSGIKIEVISKYPCESKVFSLPKTTGKDFRIVIDLSSLGDKYDNTETKNKKTRSRDKKFVIAIDAGHGGRDPGAVGRKGTKEKDVVLEISKNLYSLLKKEKNIKPVLIRNKDYFVPLRRRIDKARKVEADLFLSIHADAARNKKAKGSSIYVLSQRGASSEAAKWLADKENSADLIGGVKLEDKDDILASVLLDLSQSATIEKSISVAKNILKKLTKVGKLHSPRVEQAGFVVLKSPDIPSTLIETAFISNRTEEKKLRSKRFKKSIARAIRDGILSSIKSKII